MRLHLPLVALVGALLTACSNACPQSIEDYCERHVRECPLTWKAAQQPSSWGVDCKGPSHIILTSCRDGYIARIAGVDSGTTYYYDATGALFRIDDYVAPTASDSCIAGTSNSPPTCNDNARDVDVCAVN
jgi:hypothetical protein